MNEIHRQSGRTTRMIEEACRAAEAGHPVVIVVETDKSAPAMRKRVRQVWEAPGRDLRVSPSIEVVSIWAWEQRGAWDWENLRPRYADRNPDHLWLVDHYVIEMKIAELQAEIKHLAGLAGKLYPHTV